MLSFRLQWPQFISIFFSFAQQCHFQSYFFFIRIALLRHFIIVTFPLPLSRSNPIRHLFSNFIVTSQLKTVKNLAVMMIFSFCILFCINYSLSFCYFLCESFAQLIAVLIWLRVKAMLYYVLIDFCRLKKCEDSLFLLLFFICFYFY